MLLGATLLGWLFIMPLVLYALGTISHVIARIVGGKGSPYTARFALFWALLCAAPVWLLWGLVAGFIGPGVQLSLVGLLALVVFLLFWSINLREAERARSRQTRQSDAVHPRISVWNGASDRARAAQGGA